MQWLHALFGGYANTNVLSGLSLAYEGAKISKGLPGMFKYFFISLRGWLGLLVAAVMLYGALPALVAQIYSGIRIDCNEFSNTRVSDKTFLPITLIDCHFQPDPVILDVDSGVQFYALGHDTPARVYIRTLAGEETQRNLVVYSSIFETETLAENIKVQQQLTLQPKVVAQKNTLFGAELVATSLFLVVALWILFSVWRSSTQRMRDSYKRSKAELAGISEVVINSSTNHTVSLSGLIKFRRHLNRLLFLLQLLLGFFLLMHLVMIFDGSIHPLVLSSSALFLIVSMKLTSRIKKQPNRLGKYSIASIGCYITLLISVVTWSDFQNATTANQSEVLLIGAVFSGVILLFTLVLCAFHNRVGQYCVQTDPRAYFQVLATWQELRCIHQLTWVKRLLIPGRYSVAGAMLLVSAFLMFFLISAFVVVAGPSAISIAGLISYYIWRRAKARMLPDAQEVLRRDGRAPILLLRAFMDDETIVETGFNIKKRFEEELTKQLADLGPPVAIGDPKESVRKIGAFRTYCTNDNWQEQAIAWMQESRFIVMIAGATEMLGWEFHRIVDRGLLNKLIYVMPPEAPKLREARWHMFRQQLSGTIFEAEAMRLQPEAVLALQFDKQGGITSYTSDNLRILDYWVAMQYVVTANVLRLG